MFFFKEGEGVDDEICIELSDSEELEEQGGDMESTSEVSDGMDVASEDGVESEADATLPYDIEDAVYWDAVELLGDVGSGQEHETSDVSEPESVQTVESSSEDSESESSDAESESSDGCRRSYRVRKPPDRFSP